MNSFISRVQKDLNRFQKKVEKESEDIMKRIKKVADQAKKNPVSEKSKELEKLLADHKWKYIPQPEHHA